MPSWFCRLLAAKKRRRAFALADAVSEGKRFLHQAMANALPIGKINAINHGFAPIPIEYI